MKPAEDSITQYEFTETEIQILKEQISSPLMNAYLRSTLAQIRESLLLSVPSPVEGTIDSDKKADLTLSFISGATEFFAQVTRIGD